MVNKNDRTIMNNKYTWINKHYNINWENVKPKPYVTSITKNVIYTQLVHVILKNKTMYLYLII